MTGHGSPPLEGRRQRVYGAIFDFFTLWERFLFGAFWGPQTAPKHPESSQICLEALVGALLSRLEGGQVLCLVPTRFVAKRARTFKCLQRRRARRQRAPRGGPRGCGQISRGGFLATPTKSPRGGCLVEWKSAQNVLGPIFCSNSQVRQPLCLPHCLYLGVCVVGELSASNTRLMHLNTCLIHLSFFVTHHCNVCHPVAVHHLYLIHVLCACVSNCVSVRNSL